MGKTSKVVIFGMKGVGKTAILEQAIYGGITKESFINPTIEDTYCANIETERGSRERVRFYDTGPLARELSQSPHCLADGFLLVFNPSRAESLDWLIQIKKEIDKVREKKEAVFVVLSHQIVGHSSDVSVVGKAEGWVTREKVKMYQINALERTSLYPPLVFITSKMSQPQPKSSFPQLGIRKKD